MKRNMMIAIAASILLTALSPTVHAISPPADQKAPSEACLSNGQPITEENVMELLRKLEQDWPTGTVWGTDKTPGTHKNEVPSTESGRILQSYRVSNTYGCGAYASMISSLIFGDTANPGRKLEDLSQIRPGDIIFRVRNDTGKIWHVNIALESPNEQNAFYITDGNAGETIQWPDEESPYSNMDNLDCYRGSNRTYHGGLDPVSGERPLHRGQCRHMAGEQYKIGGYMRLKPPIPRMNSPNRNKASTSQTAPYRMRSFLSPNYASRRKKYV